MIQRLIKQFRHWTGIEVVKNRWVGLRELEVKKGSYDKDKTLKTAGRAVLRRQKRRADLRAHQGGIRNARWRG